VTEFEDHPLADSEPPTTFLATALGTILVLIGLAGLGWLAFQWPYTPVSSQSAPSNEASTVNQPGPIVAERSNVPLSIAPAAPTLAPQHTALDAALPRDPEAPPCAFAEGVSVAAGANKNQVRDRLKSTLAASPDELMRATALVLGAQSGQGSSLTPVASENSVAAVSTAAGPPASAAAPVCQGGGPCFTSPDKVESAAATKTNVLGQQFSRDTLARMALISTSASVYAMAWQLCHPIGMQDSGGGVCLMLSAEQWAHLDPDNAAPWLEVAKQAQTRADTAALADAMFRASKARTVNLHWGHAAELVLKQVSPELSMVQAIDLSTELQRFERSWATQGYQVALGYCKAEHQSDPNRHQQCVDLTEMFTSKGRSLADFSTGLSLAQQGSVPLPQLQALTLEHQALNQALNRTLSTKKPTGSAPGTAPAKATDCLALQQSWRDARALVQQGEMNLARAAALQSTHKLLPLAPEVKSDAKVSTLLP
jgi:hypothetical protein